MSNIKVTVLQLDTKWKDASSNLLEIESFINHNSGSDLYVLPEMFNSGFTNDFKRCAEPLDGITITKIKELSTKSDAAIAGSMITKIDNKYYNTFIFVEPDNKVHLYHKRHLFSHGGEKGFDKGKENVIINFRSFKIALFVCYDLRFPVWCRNTSNYDIMIFVAAWAKARRYAFDTLLKARAIENISYVIASNRVGIDGNAVEFDGGSTIIDYKGHNIIKAIDGEANVISAELNLNDLHLFRNHFSALKDKDNFKILI